MSLASRPEYVGPFYDNLRADFASVETVRCECFLKEFSADGKMMLLTQAPGVEAWLPCILARGTEFSTKDKFGAVHVPEWWVQKNKFAYEAA